MQRKIEQGGALLSQDGSLRESGYALRPILEYDRKSIRERANRIKEWDRYIIIDPAFAIDLSLADYASVGMDTIAFFDFTESKAYTRNRVQFIEKGDKLLSPTSVIGDSISKGRRYSIEFRNGGNERHLLFSMKRFAGNRDISGDIVLACPACDHIVTAQPLSDNGKLFAYRHKVQGLAASGTIRLGKKEYLLTPGRSYGAFSWVRGVWGKTSEWLWAGAAGVPGGTTLSFNLGSGSGNAPDCTENVIFHQGVAHKLADAQWDIPMRDGAVRQDEPWHVSSDDGRIDLVFSPHAGYKNRLNLGFVRLQREQLFGTFSGNVLLDDGTGMDIESMSGFVERVRNRW